MAKRLQHKFFSYRAHPFDLQPGLGCLLFHENNFEAESNRARRRLIFQTIYDCISPVVGRGTRVYPDIIRQIVRLRWPDSDGSAGHYDAQHRGGIKITLEDFIEVDWGDCRCS